MKYNVAIPPPSAKRMLGRGQVFVYLDNGWESMGTKSYPVAPEQVSLEFEVLDCYEWIRATSVSDGPTFDVWIEYTNEKGTRSEKITLVPQRCGDGEARTGKERVQATEE